MTKPTDTKERFLKALESLPFIVYACGKTGINKSTVYRWMKDNLDFRQAVDRAREIGYARFNDVAESKLFNLINKNNLKATIYYLNRVHPRYRPKVQFTSPIQAVEREIRDEIRRRLAEQNKEAGPLVKKMIDVIKEADLWDKVFPDDGDITPGHQSTPQ